MGYDLHITKAEDWTEAGSQPISDAEVKQLVASDQTLAVSTTDYYDRDGGEGETERIPAILWTTHPDEEVAFWFQDGEITAKNPDDATIIKMLEMAERLQAQLLGDDGEVYQATSSPPGWEMIS